MDSTKNNNPTDSPSTATDVKPADTSDAPASNTWDSAQNPASSPEAPASPEPKPLTEPAFQAGSDDSSQTPSAVNPMAITQPTAPKKKGGMVIVIAIIIFLMLAVAAYFVYTSGNDSSKASQSKQPASTAQVSQAKTSDVDQTNQALDKDLSSVDDNKDFTSTDLSDASLGL